MAGVVRAAGEELSLQKGSEARVRVLDQRAIAAVSFVGEVLPRA